MEIKSLDALIIGCNLSALLQATRLYSAGKSFSILDSQPKRTDSSFAGVSTLSAPDLLLSLPQEADRISSLFATLNLGPTPDPREIPIEILEGNTIKPFYGFSETRWESCDALPYFQNREWVDASPMLSIGRNDFPEVISEHIEHNSEITKFEMKEARNFLVAAGEKRIYQTPAVYIAEPLGAIKSWLPNDLIPPKTQLKLKKSKKWGAVQLVQAFQEPVGQIGKISLLLPTPKDTVEPAFGRIFTLSDEGAQVGLWTSLVPTDLLADPEAAAHVVKFLKKGVAKAFPIQGGPAHQKIIVTDEWWSQDVKISSDFKYLSESLGVHFLHKCYHPGLSPIAAQVPEDLLGNAVSTPSPLENTIAELDQ